MTNLPPGFQPESNGTPAGFPVRENMCARLRDQRTENSPSPTIHEGSPTARDAEPVDNLAEHPAMDGRSASWSLSWRADPRAAALADRHYTRQSPGSPQFVPPGRCLVLTTPTALWVTSWPFAEYVRHAWAGAWICSLFRNEGDALSSDLIRAAVAATRWQWPDVPDLGMVTFVDADKVRRKRDPGRCYLRAGFERVGETAGGLIALQMLPAAMPEPCAPAGAQLVLGGA